jgi:polyisoprenoid-binding protein YceI
MRDSELRGESFFHVEEYPEATWESGDIAADGDGFVAEGTLTLRGIEKNQPVRLELSGSQPPVLSGRAEILRLQWNVGTGEDYEDTDFLRNRVDLEFELQLQPYSEG